MKTLIVYSSTEGQTKKICDFIYSQLCKAGVETELMDAKNIYNLNQEYDMYILAGSVHIGNYQNSLRKFASKFHQKLNTNPSAFLSVSLTAAGNKKEDRVELGNITSKFLKKTKWKPHFVLQVAGALRYSKYNFIKKWIMKRIAEKNGVHTKTSQDYEYTDWDQLRDFTSAVIKDHAGVTVS